MATLGLLLAHVAVQPQAVAPQVPVLRIDGVIGPATSDFVRRGLDRARAESAPLVVLQIDTPGGLDTAMRAIVKDILASPVPVAAFVGPEGARAASAGLFIVYASHVAAMAPATNLGAATPVAIGMPGLPARRGPPAAPAPQPRAGDGKAPGGGTDEGAATDAPAGAGEGAAGPEDTSRAKVVNDAAAYIRSLAQLRGRNADFADRAVRQASSLSAADALQAGVIDLIAADLPALLKQIDGREIHLAHARTTLDLSGAATAVMDPGWRSRVLALLSNPTLAAMLMMLGVYGLFIEFTSPGFGVPGVAGAISLLLGLYALQLLPVNWAGLALLMFGAALMIAEVFIPSFGVLGIGGIAAFVFGGLMLIDTDAPGFGLPLGVVIAAALTSAALIIGVGGFALRARARRVVSGREELPGAVGMVENRDGEDLWVRVHGESWRARMSGGDQAAVGDTVRVRRVDGLLLQVEPMAPAAGTAEGSA